VEKRLDSIADVYYSTINLVKRLSTYNLYDLQSIENILETFHRKWTALKVKKKQGLNLKFLNQIVLFLDGNFTS
jgi:hypothetical protein